MVAFFRVLLHARQGIHPTWIRATSATAIRGGREGTISEENMWIDFFHRPFWFIIPNFCGLRNTIAGGSCHSAEKALPLLRTGSPDV